MRVMALHNINDLDGAGACWCVEKQLSSEVEYMQSLMSDYPVRLIGYDEIYLFGTNSNEDSLRAICSRNAKVYIWSTSRLFSRLTNWETKPVNLYVMETCSSYCRTISYKLKTPENVMINSIDSIVQGASSPDLDCVSEYIKLAIPYNSSYFKKADFVLNKNYEMAVNIGYGIAAGRKHIDDELEKRARGIIFEGYEALVINCVVDFAEVAKRLASLSKSGLGITWRCTGRSVFHFSIASTNSSRINCGKLAREHGGGGVLRRSGFKVDSFDKLKTILDGMYNQSSSISSNQSI